MDAVDFLNKYNRMCKYYNSCTDCPIQMSCMSTEPKAMVNIVEQWDKEHPQRTIMDDFFEKFPNALRTKRGFPVACAKELGYGRLDSCSFGIKGTPGAECSKCWERTLEDK